MKNPFNKMKTKLMELPIWLHMGLVPTAYLAMTWVKGMLDASYVASKFPVNYMTGQTSFSGTAIKAWYNTMIEQGTLGIYWQTQAIDFGFIISVIALGLIFGTFMARLAIKGRWAYKMGMLAALVIPLGGIFDACENLTSFILLSMPTSFPDWLALPYSGFASVKFGFLTLGMLLLAMSLSFNLGERLVIWLRTAKLSRAKQRVEC